MAKQIMCISDDLCFIWSFKDNCVFVLRLDDNSTDDTKCIKLIPTDTPLFDVDKIIISGTGRWICVWGTRGATAMEVPRRSGKNRKFIGVEADGSSVVVHSVPIAERYFMCHPRAVLQQASWHPGSQFDGHLMTLTSDNTIRIFNLDAEQESAEETIHLSEGSMSNLFGKSALSVKGSLGETAVGFDFAPPAIGTWSGEDQTAPTNWPIFILWGDGRVFFRHH
jgi:nuclear pore complex protein Nup88